MTLPSKRRNPPPEHILAARQAWGQHLQDHLDRVGMTRTTLAALVGYKHPKSADQLVSGQNGASLPVLRRVLEVFPEMAPIDYPEPHAKDRQRGAYGPHKEHEYPEDTLTRPPIRGRLPPVFLPVAGTRGAHASEGLELR